MNEMKCINLTCADSYIECPRPAYFRAKFFLFLSYRLNAFEPPAQYPLSVSPVRRSVRYSVTGLTSPVDNGL